MGRAEHAVDGFGESVGLAARFLRAGREVVDNWNAQVGDVTVCPISGKKFEVGEDAGHFDYQGYSFVFCCSGSCIDKLAADPGKYLDALVEEAGGPKEPADAAPSADPDPADGGAIDDGPDAG